MRLLILGAAVIFLAQYSVQLAVTAVIVLFVGGWLWQFVDWLASPRSSGIGSAHQRQIGPGNFVTCYCSSGRH